MPMLQGTVALYPCLMSGGSFPSLSSGTNVSNQPKYHLCHMLCRSTEMPRIYLGSSTSASEMAPGDVTLSQPPLEFSSQWCLH